MSANQNPEQIARDTIDAQLMKAGWAVQAKDAIDFYAGPGQAVREYHTDTGPADYVLFVDGRLVQMATNSGKIERNEREIDGARQSKTLRQAILKKSSPTASSPNPRRRTRVHPPRPTACRAR